MHDYDHIKENITNIKKYATSLDLDTLKLNNTNQVIRISFSHNYSELALEIKNITTSSTLTEKEKNELLLEISESIVELTIKLNELN